MGKAGKLKAKVKMVEREAAAKAKKNDRLTRKELKKQLAREKNYESNEEREFAAQMHALGCKIKHIAGDGNCMFRSFADQIDGDPNNHGEMRKRIMDYIEGNQEHFSLFMEDDEDFETYLHRMRRDKEWGGHPELYAASQILQVDIVVHQYNTPRFVLQCESPSKRIHLSYHGEFHYNSVRGLTDSMDGVPAPITLQEAPPAGVAAPVASRPTPARQSRENAVQLVEQSIPWANMYSVETALDLTSGDALEAIDLLLAHGENFEPASIEEDAITAVAELSLDEAPVSAKKTKAPSKRHTARSNPPPAETKMTSPTAAAESTKPLSKKEKRMLRQGRNQAPATTPTPASLAVQAGEVVL